jgi:hypothetical protein
MSTIPYQDQTQDWNPEQDQPATPGRPRRRWFNRRSAALAAAITCAAGFYAGVRVEKSQVSSPSAASTASPASATARSGTAGAGAGAGARAGFPGAAGAGAGSNASFGTVSSVDGNTIYLTDSSGNTVKVTLSSATKISKSETVAKAAVRPGDTVVIQGLKGSGGAITATSVSDSGTNTARGGTGTTTTGNASSATSGSSTTG